jgi:hypothetical protein
MRAESALATLFVCAALVMMALAKRRCQGWSFSRVQLYRVSLPKRLYKSNQD